jgi:rhodanese-related sulfurtransferase
MAQIYEFIGNHPWLLAALVASIIFIFLTEFRLRAGPKSVSSAQAVRLINDTDAVLLDIRETAEFAAGHIINAKSLPLSKLTEEIESMVKDKSKQLIVYCKSGAQSVAACQTLLKSGYENICYLKGGLFAWQEDKLPIEK